MRRANLFVLLLSFAIAACAAGPEPAAPAQLRVMAYNIKHGQGMDGRVDLERIAAVIRAQAPDVVTLQEIDQLCGRTEFVDQAKVLGELCDMSYAFGEFMPYDEGRYGMALLSRHPIVEATNILLPPGAEPRSALEALIRLPGGQQVIVTGIHLYATEAQRLAQAQLLADRYSESDLPVILAGDFNSQPDTAVMNELARIFAIVPKNGANLTFPSDTPAKEIDFVLLRPADAFAVRRHVVIDEAVASDHRPLVIDLELR